MTVSRLPPYDGVLIPSLLSSQGLVKEYMRGTGVAGVALKDGAPSGVLLVNPACKRIASFLPPSLRSAANPERRRAPSYLARIVLADTTSNPAPCTMSIPYNRSVILTLSCLPASNSALIPRLQSQRSSMKKQMRSAGWTVSHWGTPLPAKVLWENPAPKRMARF